MTHISCIIIDDEPIAREIIASYIKRIDILNLVGSCQSAIEAFNIINQQNVDLLFLDINMPGISGLSFARSINKNIKIIFTTAYREYAVEGFDLQAVDYLLKPISIERFNQSISKFIKEHRAANDNTTSMPDNDSIQALFVRSDRRMVKIYFDEIQYIESIGDYLKLHLKDKILTIRETISNLEAKLPKQNFARIHRSFIVSISHITSYTHTSLHLADTVLPISRSYKQQIISRLSKQ